MAFQGWKPTWWATDSEARNAIHVLKIIISSSNIRIRRAIVTDEPEGKVK